MVSGANRDKDTSQHVSLLSVPFGLFPRTRTVPSCANFKEMRHSTKFSLPHEEGNNGNDNCCFGCCFCSICSRTTRKIILASIAVIVSVFLVLIAAVLIIAAVNTSSPLTLVTLDTNPKFINFTETEKLQRAKLLGEAIRFPTISYNKSFTDTDALQDLHAFLNATYADVFNAPFVTRYTINTHSLLLKVHGKIATSNPYLLCGHLDVVPEGTGTWSGSPFSGEIIEDPEDGKAYVFGRGAIDDKQSVLGILESLRYLILNDGQPQRTFYVAFGHDEEVGGDKGAGQIAKKLRQLLKDNDEQLSFILDEGMFVMENVFPGVSDPVAYVGVVEKGWVEVNMTVNGQQGHSSAPPKESTIGILAKAISNLENNPQPSRFGAGVEYDTMRYVSPFASFGYKVALSNLWLFNPIISKILANDAATDAIQRSTTAVTIVKGGDKNNVVPGMASALINHRIHPSDTATTVFDNDVATINDDRVKLTMLDNFKPTKVSRYDSDFAPFQVIANSIFEVIPSVVLTPGTMVANTDTKHYLDMCDAIYRFQPVRLSKSDISRFHGVDERISVDNFEQVIQFYYRLIQNANFDLIEKEANNDNFFLNLPEDDFYEDNNSTESVES